jgi:hypothetical protein
MDQSATLLQKGASASFNPLDRALGVEKNEEEPNGSWNPLASPRRRVCLLVVELEVPLDELGVERLHQVHGHLQKMLL